MKLFQIGLLALSVRNTVATLCATCSCQQNESQCNSFEDTGGCYYDGGDCHDEDPDGLHAGAPGPGEIGGFCNSKYTENGGKPKYMSVSSADGVDCASGTVCRVDGDDGAAGTIDGVCETETCHGKADPEINEYDDNPDNEASIRVTICHRTCSENNPWVRITIDDDAWNGTAASGCGHMLQHDVGEEDCPGKNYDMWGQDHRMDYLIKWHGTRDFLAASYDWGDLTCNSGGKCSASSDAEKDYWFYWERACPSVRNGVCCGNEQLGACCGDDEYPLMVADALLTDDPTQAPTMAPVVPPTPSPVEAIPAPCGVVMGATSSTVCTPVDSVDTVTMVEVKVGDSTPGILDPTDLIYDISHTGTSYAPQVTFKMDNPFDFNVDMYVQYHEKKGSKGAFDPACLREIQKPGCHTNADTVTAACIAPVGRTPFSIVSVYFVSTESIFANGGGAKIDQCCNQEATTLLNDDPVIEYTFEIKCACPMESRNLRGDLADSFEAWLQAIGN
jgi:hypothetical protein